MTQIEIGVIGTAVGEHGECLIHLLNKNTVLPPNFSSIFIDIQGQRIPFFVDSCQFKAGKYVLGIDGISSKEKAQELEGKSIFVPLSILPTPEGIDFHYNQIIGFTVNDERLGHIGILTEVWEYPHQNIFVITHHSKKEVLVPALKDFIKHCDMDNKKLMLNTPDGLIDLYLE